MDGVGVRGAVVVAAWTLPQVGQSAGWKPRELQNRLCQARLQKALRLHSSNNGVDGNCCVGGSVVVVLLLSQMHNADSGGQSLAQTPVKIGDRRCRCGPCACACPDDGTVQCGSCEDAGEEVADDGKKSRLDSDSTGRRSRGVADAKRGGSASDKKRADGAGLQSSVVVKIVSDRRCVPQS